MSANNRNTNSPNPNDAGANDWASSWDERRGEIDEQIAGSFQQGRTVDDTFADVSTATASWFNQGGAFDDTDYRTQFRDYYSSRLEDMERNGRLSRRDRTYDVNPEWAPEATNLGTAGNRLAEGAQSAAGSAGYGGGVTGGFASTDSSGGLYLGVLFSPEATGGSTPGANNMRSEQDRANVEADASEDNQGAFIDGAKAGLGQDGTSDPAQAGNVGGRGVNRPGFGGAEFGNSMQGTMSTRGFTAPGSEGLNQGGGYPQGGHGDYGQAGAGGSTTNNDPGNPGGTGASGSPTVGGGQFGGGVQGGAGKGGGMAPGSGTNQTGTPGPGKNKK